MPQTLRFLTYTPWSGQLNNTRICFETALVFAFVTGRTLVFPVNYRLGKEPALVRGRFRPLHPGEFLNLSLIGTLVKLLSYREYESVCGGGVGKTNVRFGLNTSVFCYPHIPKIGSVEYTDLVNFASGRSDFLEFGAETNNLTTINIESANLEHFYAFFFLDHIMSSACKALVRDHVRFKPEIIDLASVIASRLGPFSAAHIRRSDFIRQYLSQNISIRSIMRNVARYITLGSRLYVSTDECDLGFFDLLRDHYDVLFMENIAGFLPRKMSKVSLACFEQELCSLADTFVGTRLSTFSGYITRLRGYRNALDKESYFTDGYHTKDRPVLDTHPYSWSSWLKSGNPLWGREYREGWEW
jgi:GDP-fucose protein O-fucosyltransferase